MLKVTFAVLAVVLAGTASAAGWRNLRIDASSEASFTESVETLQEKLSPSRRHAFERAMQEIWLLGVSNASADQRDYTRDDYFAQLNGLGYEEIVLLLDPSGEKEQRYRAEFYNARAAGPAGAAPGFSEGPAPPPVSGGVYRGWTNNGGIRLESNAGMR